MRYDPRFTRTFLSAIFVTLMLALAAPPARAQTETFEPYILRADQTDLRVWTSGDHTFARVNITFNDGCYRVADVGPVTRQGNALSVDFTTEHWTGGCTQALVYKEYFFDLGALAAEAGPAAYSFTVKSRGVAVKSVTFDPRLIVEHWEEASIARGYVGFAVWTAGGVTFASVSIGFPDDGYRIVDWEEPVRVGNDFVSHVRLERWTGYASALVHKGDRRLFSLGVLPPDERFTVSVEFSDGVRQTSFSFTPAGTARPASMNPSDDPAFFVRQHYLDFLGREPDAEGLTFWTDEINSCIFFPSPCADVKRVNVSAAFFLSIEFQRTGFYVYRLHKAAFGTMPRFAEFLADTRRVAEGVVVKREGWEALLEENQRRFAEEFVARPEFKALYPEAMTPEQYVDALDHMIAHPFSENEPGPLTATDRSQLVEGLYAGTETRGSVLRKVAANDQFVSRELNRAFVLMQYYGYLRRNPDEGRDTNWDGYDYWLQKLNLFRGDYVAAEMVKAFISSDEYRKRFGPQP